MHYSHNWNAAGTTRAIESGLHHGVDDMDARTRCMTEALQSWRRADMKIKRIKIENFRGLDALELEFVDPGGRPLDLVLLAGPNGSGKTSVIEACLLALGKNNLSGKSPDEAANADIRKGRDGYKIEIAIENNGKETLLSRTDRDNPKAGRRFLKENSIAIEYYSSWRAPGFVGSVPITAGKKQKIKASQKNRLEILKQYLVNLKARGLFEGSVSEGSVKSGSVHLSIAEKEKNAFDRLNTSWKMLHPQTCGELLVKPSGEDIDEGFDLFQYAPRLKEFIPVDSLSSGEIEIITMLGSFAIKDYAGGVVFIDEPELHLHTAWHRTFLRAIRAALPETQFICATHSEALLESAYSYQRFTLLPEDDPRIRLVVDNIVNG